jgi:hypothetical protein
MESRRSFISSFIVELHQHEYTLLHAICLSARCRRPSFAMTRVSSSLFIHSSWRVGALTRRRGVPRCETERRDGGPVEDQGRCVIHQTFAIQNCHAAERMRRRLAMAVADTASGGETMAPSAMASAHPIPGNAA